MAKDLQTLIERAIAAADTAEQRAADATEATRGQFRQLHAQLHEARATVARGGVPDCAGLLRWVADWIPDIDDPLLARVGALERAATKSMLSQPSLRR